MPDLPSGTVTFLFTDIEGSTATRIDDRCKLLTINLARGRVVPR